MQHLEVSGAVRPIYASLGFKGLNGKAIYEVKKRLVLGIDLQEKNLRCIILRSLRR